MLTRLALAGCLVVAATAGRADEVAFLHSLAGNWAGKGKVKVRVHAPTISVSCKFRSSTTADTLLLDGSCRGLLIFSRKISAELQVHDDIYSGTYIGAGTGPSQLSGSRSGEAINLAIRWAKDVNGDRDAQMVVERLGENGMSLTTIDTDPKTGKEVVTSRIDLKRS